MCLGTGGWEENIDGGVDDDEEDDGDDAGEEVAEPVDVVVDVVRVLSELRDSVVQYIIYFSKSGCIVINQLGLQELGNVNQKRNYDRRNNEDK